MKLKTVIPCDLIRWVTCGACSYICMCINTIANNAVLQLYSRYDFYNIIVKVKHKLYIAHETATCRNAPIYTFTGEIKKPWHILHVPAFKHVMFLRKCKEKQLFCVYKILTGGVFVT